MRQGHESNGSTVNHHHQPVVRSSKAKMTKNHPSGNQYELHPNYLGNMKMKKLPFLKKELIISPDLAAWIGPTTVSLVLAIGGLLLAGDQMEWYEHAAFYMDVIAAFSLSLLCGTTDPGIYPRLARGEPDPLEYESYKRCDACGLKRPPRAAHCYLCGVCVLEHDHHCGIVGGCIGQRTLRFFVAYLCTISSSATMMFLFLLRSIFRYSGGMMAMPARRGGRHAAKLAASTVAPAVTEAMKSVMKKGCLTSICSSYYGDDDDCKHRTHYRLYGHLLCRVDGY